MRSLDLVIQCLPCTQYHDRKSEENKLLMIVAGWLRNSVLHALCLVHFVVAWTHS
jgi:hypothetical protein